MGYSLCQCEGPADGGKGARTQANPDLRAADEGISGGWSPCYILSEVTPALESHGLEHHSQLRHFPS